MSSLRLSTKRLSTKASTRIKNLILSFLFIGLAVISLISAWLFPQFWGNLRTNMTAALTPAVEAITTPLVEIKNLITDINIYLSLKQQHARLKQDNEKLMAWYLQAQSLKAENQELRALVAMKNLPNIAEFKTISAPILNDTSADFAKSILIRAGTAHKVTQNSIAISAYGLVGRVTEASEKSARIMLITDINARIPVLIKTNDRLIHAILSGQNNAPPQITHVQDQSQLSALYKSTNSHVMTSGTGNLYPYGLPVGRLSMDKNNALIVAPYMRSGDFQFVNILPPQTALDINQTAKEQ